MCIVVFLDALASLDFKLSVAQSLMFFTASASTGLSDLFVACRFAVEMLGEEQG